MKRWAPLQTGFTIVEILIVIAVIGVLSAIGFVGYTGARQNAATATLRSDLANASKQMDLAYVNNRAYPVTLPSSIKASPNVTLSLVASATHYSGLSNVQNGTLLAQICQNLVDEGLGSGLNMGGGTDNYITGCGNWNNGSMQVTGWTSRVFNTPIADNTFTNYANAIPPGDAWHPNQQPVTQNFYRQLHDRLIAQGGSFPVTTFWDSWATPFNGGVMQQPLPAPDNTPGSTYCLQAAYNSNQVWHIAPGNQATEGAC